MNDSSKKGDLFGDTTPRLFVPLTAEELDELRKTDAQRKPGDRSGGFQNCMRDVAASIVDHGDTKGVRLTAQTSGKVRHYVEHSGSGGWQNRLYPIYTAMTDYIAEVHRDRSRAT